MVEDVSYNVQWVSKCRNACVKQNYGFVLPNLGWWYCVRSL